MLSTKEQKQMKELREANTALQIKLQYNTGVINKIKEACAAFSNSLNNAKDIDIATEEKTKKDLG